MAKRKTDQESADVAAPCSLTYREERFIDYYLRNGGNASAAYREANPKTPPGSARVLGCRLLTKVHIQAALDDERTRLKEFARFQREDAIRLLVALATTTPDEVAEILRRPSQQESYEGLGDKRFAVSVQKTPDGYVASAPTVSERRAAINDLWDKLKLDKDASQEDRVSFLGRFAQLGERLGRPSDKGGQTGGEGSP